MPKMLIKLKTNLICNIPNILKLISHSEDIFLTVKIISMIICMFFVPSHIIQDKLSSFLKYAIKNNHN